MNLVNNIKSNENIKWVIGIVNFNSAVYLKYIIKTLYDFNNKDRFKLIIVDNSFPHERIEIEEIVKNYESNNIEIIYNTPTAKNPSAQHGEALNLVLEKARIENVEFLLVHDPDFFWVRKEYLAILEKYFLEGYVAVGAPYRSSKIIIDGDKNFPAAFGCAYKMQELNGIDFSPSSSLNEITELGRDVGWQMRDKLSKKKFFSFPQMASDIHRALGNFSYDVNPYEYYGNDNFKIAYHLFKGSRGNMIPQKTLKGYDGTDMSGYTDLVDIKYVREGYGKFFYDQALHSNSIKKFATILLGKLNKKFIWKNIGYKFKRLRHEVQYILWKNLYPKSNSEKFFIAASKRGDRDWAIYFKSRINN